MPTTVAGEVNRLEHVNTRSVVDEWIQSAAAARTEVERAASIVLGTRVNTLLQDDLGQHLTNSRGYLLGVLQRRAGRNNEELQEVLDVLEKLDTFLRATQ